MKCPYCGFESQIAKSEDRVAELDYRTYLEKAAGEKDTQESKKVQCSKFGAETTVLAGTAADMCPFCGSNMVLSESVSRLIKPEGLLPFKISQKEAFDKFRGWIRKLWFAPGPLKQYATAESKLAGV